MEVMKTEGMILDTAQIKSRKSKNSLNPESKVDLQGLKRLEVNLK